MNHCFLMINLDGISEKSSIPGYFFQKKSLFLHSVPAGSEKIVFLVVSTGKMRFLSYLIWINVCDPESERTFP